MPSNCDQRSESAAVLEIEKDVLLEEGGFVALSSEPWLRLASRILDFRGQFVRLCFEVNFFEAPVRPLLRFWFGSGRFRDYILPAPTEGVGIWLGRIPLDCTQVWISPTNRIGRFDFRLTDMRRASFFEVARRAIFSPKRVFYAVSARMVKLTEEAELNWRWALGCESLRAYRQWRDARRFSSTALQPLEQAQTEARAFVIFLDICDASPADIDASCRSIEAQSYPFWHVRYLGAPSEADTLKRLAAWEKRPKFGRFEASDALAGFDLAARLRAGDVLEIKALASFAAHFSKHSELSLVYADEAVAERAGGLRPVWKPAWSPIFQKSFNYIGRAAFFKTAMLADYGDWTQLSANELVDRLASSMDPKQVGSIRRSLFITPTQGARSVIREMDAICRSHFPSVSIVIPTRDRADLLEDCLASLFEKTTYRNYDVVLVDNDSVEQKTHSLIDRMQKADKRLKVLRQAGAFNFSALSNAGAAACTGEYLVFLNNDTQIVTPDWIERLLYFAMDPDVGAVGAKLLYPNGRIQHVGVALGMGGVAGHFGAGLDRDAAGWLCRNLVPHEVSAVTGACMMVARGKFEATGRFDAENLPVDLNDVDLCLRLGSHGWRTICHSQVVLIHRQSASRGGAFRLQQVYEKERSYFLDQWRAVIRDDPYFHPSLSLYAYEEMLP